MAITEYYVDPAINANSGAGTIGSPWGDLQYALNQINHAGNGARINVKAGTAEVLVSTALSYTTYLGTNGAGSATEPLIIEGYTSTAGDGGIGEVSGVANSLAVWGGADSQDADYVTFKNMKLTGGQATGYAITIDNQCTFINCEIISPHAGIDIDMGIIDHCKISYVDTAGIVGAFGQVAVINSYLVQTSTTLCAAIAGCQPIINNIINVRAATTPASVGVITISAGFGNVILGNTILANISSGTSNANAIRVDTPNALVANNYIEGFNGTNNEAIDISSSSVSSIIANNAYYGNTANVNDTGLNTISIGSTTSLAASGVTNASGEDFTPTAELKAVTGYPSSFWQLSGNATYPKVGAIKASSSGGTNTVDPLSSTIPGI